MKLNQDPMGGLVEQEEEEPGADAEKRELEEGVNVREKQGVKEGDKYIINSLVIIYE